MRKPGNKLIAIMMALLIQSNYAVMAFATDEANNSKPASPAPAVSDSGNSDNSNSESDKTDEKSSGEGNSNGNSDTNKQSQDNNSSEVSDNESDSTTSKDDVMPDDSSSQKETSSEQDAENQSSDKVSDNKDTENNEIIGDQKDETNTDPTTDENGTLSETTDDTVVDGEEQNGELADENQLEGDIAEEEAPLSEEELVEIHVVKPEIVMTDDLSYYVGQKRNANIRPSIPNISDLNDVTYNWYKLENRDDTEGVLCESSSEITFNVDTSEKGNFYYYCEVTNTVTDENGNEHSATTKSDVVGVTIRDFEESDAFYIDNIEFQNADYKQGDKAKKFRFSFSDKLGTLTMKCELFEKSSDGELIPVGEYSKDEESSYFYEFSPSTEEIGSKTYCTILTITLEDGTEFVKREELFGTATINVLDPNINFTYNILPDGTYELSNILGETKDVVIPDEYNGVPITKVSLNVLKKAKGNLTIGKNVNNIADNTFTQKGEINCTISISSENESYASDNGNIFNKDMSIIYCYLQKTDDSKVVVPDSVVEIADYAFSNVSLYDKELMFGNNVEKIGNHAFSDCYYNGEIVFPNSLKEIGNFAFSGNKEISAIDFGNSIERIGEYAFSQCDLIKTVALPSTISYIGESAFFSCFGIEKLSIERGGINPIDIGTQAFAKNVKLKSVKLPKNIGNIGKSCFAFDYSLEDFEFEKGSTNTRATIGDFCFNNTKSLKKIVIPDYVQKIGDCAFYFNSSKKLKPDNFNWEQFEFINQIENKDYRTHLEEVVIESSAEIGSHCDIGESAFFNCYVLKDLTLGEGVRNIGKNAFYKCSSLEHIDLPSTINNIGYDNSDPSTISLYNTNYAFDLCTSNKAFTVADGCENYEAIDGVLYRKYSSDNTNYRNLTNYPIGDTTREFLAIADGTRQIGERAFEQTKVKEILVSVDTWKIRGNAFRDCKSLKSIHFFRDGYGYSNFYGSAYKYNWSNCGYTTPNGDLIPPTLIMYTVPKLDYKVGEKVEKPIAVNFLYTKSDGANGSAYRYTAKWGVDKRSTIETSTSKGVGNLSNIKKTWSRDYVSKYGSISSKLNPKGLTVVTPKTDKSGSYGLFCVSEKVLPSGEKISLRTLGFVPNVLGEEIPWTPIEPSDPVKPVDPTDPVTPPTDPDEPVTPPVEPDKPVNPPYIPHHRDNDSHENISIIDVPTENDEEFIIEDEETPLAKLPLTGGKSKIELLLSGLTASLYGVTVLLKSKKDDDKEQEK